MTGLVCGDVSGKDDPIPSLGKLPGIILKLDAEKVYPVFHTRNHHSLDSSVLPPCRDNDHNPDGVLTSWIGRGIRACIRAVASVIKGHSPGNDEHQEQCRMESRNGSSASSSAVDHNEIIRLPAGVSLWCPEVYHNQATSSPPRFTYAALSRTGLCAIRTLPRDGHLMRTSQSTHVSAARRPIRHHAVGSLHTVGRGAPTIGCPQAIRSSRQRVTVRGTSRPESGGPLSSSLASREFGRWEAKRVRYASDESRLVGARWRQREAREKACRSCTPSLQ